MTGFADSNHPITSLMEIVGVLIEKYDDEHVPELRLSEFRSQILDMKRSFG